MSNFTNLAILPILLPTIAAILSVFLNKQTTITKWMTGIVVIGQMVLSFSLLIYVLLNGPIILEAGDWTAPYGIVIVADELAMLLVSTTSLIAVAAAFYGFKTISVDEQRFYYYMFFHFLIAGVSGAFLTGDLFNLFVFFEVLLMASYALIVLGGGKEQFRESVKYVLINVFSSVLFVTTIAFLYSVTGTVNMAQLAVRVGEVGQSGILMVIAIMLFVVFATKGAIFPLYFWLPKSYAVPHPVVSMLFGALLTKVGIYSILRTFTLIFGHQADFTHQLFIILGVLTIIFGVAGALSTHDIKLIIAYNIIPAVGFILIGIGVFHVTALAGAVYYLVHDMIIKAALFLLVGVIITITGTSDLRKMGGLINRYPVLGWTFFVSTLVLAGIPPFSGFIGKYLLVRGGFETGNYFALIVALLLSLLILLSVIRIFIAVFWGEETEEQKEKPTISTTGYLAPIMFLLAFSIVLGVGAEFIYPYIQYIGDTLADPSYYIENVLKE
ncbi:multicomponent Na+:H+ antiporter subunit D [Bacillus mesophilus]|uniref:Na+/H+ antiporter subunit D n=1 Tax=Bacillus mesophilus TaxID=1808955 RepID=A0A6M0Q5Q3_9BACI|nr:Na+/H+ antiporter subunit D [Bacillus mesophilus]MBM7660752.1 multicomponent Na+:H+ antiporter subunit D [Bacillus mesophilus]NEY71701.1 Na+/H+ antiporter subunit D [Bacillus mesophilus]